MNDIFEFIAPDTRGEVEKLIVRLTNLRQSERDFRLPEWRINPIEISSTFGQKEVTTFIDPIEFQSFVRLEIGNVCRLLSSLNVDVRKIH